MIAAVALLVAAATHVVTLDEAVRTARERQPQLRQARANSAAAEARTGEAFAPLLPQLSATAGYQRFIGNTFQTSATTPSLGGTGSVSSINLWTDSLTLSQLVYDFGASTSRWKAAKAFAESQSATERATALLVDFNVRSAFFNARANKALVVVAQENLDNQLKHLEQTQGMVEAGTRAEIDLIQSRTDTANARVQLINAQNTYQTSKITLNTAMGVVGPTDYDVEDASIPPVQGEDAAVDALMDEAWKARPEIKALEDQIRADQLTVRSIQGLYGPSLGVAAGARQTGPALDNLGWNAFAGVSLSWNLFQGGLTRSQVSEAEANVLASVAQLDSQRLQVRSDVDAARLAVRAAKESLGATQEALLNARERLRLAEERYQVGVGSAIELGDAQVALTQASAQAVQADQQLATARAQLLRAVGRQ